MRRLYSFILFILIICLIIFMVHPQEAVNWKTVNLLENEIPQSVLEGVKNKECFKIEDKTKVLSNNVKLFYKVGEPRDGKLEGQTVLLLHGAAFTSSTWEKRVPTIQTLSCLGYKVIAVDLPGFGKTPSSRVNRGTFIKTVINELIPKSRPVVISPSMSGSFSLPLLVNDPELISGYVPVAPVSTGQFRNRFSNIEVPTMIVQGENDRGLGTSSTRDLSLLPLSTPPQILDNAGHPAYLDQPNTWHNLLYNFLLLLN